MREKKNREVQAVTEKRHQLGQGSKILIRVGCLRQGKSGCVGATTSMSEWK